MNIKKYEEALSQNPGKIIVVHCDKCDVDYDVREVTNEVQHPYANHVTSFDCPRGHRSEARRVWKQAVLHITEGDRISLRGLKVLWDAPEKGETVKATADTKLDKKQCHTWAAQSLKWTREELTPEDRLIRICHAACIWAEVKFLRNRRRPLPV